MKNPSTALITHNQRVIDQLALENLNNLKAEKVKKEKRLVLSYLRRKLTHTANLDDSTVDLMERSEFDMVLKKAKVWRYLGLGFLVAWSLLSIFGIIGGFMLAVSGKEIGTLICAVSIFSTFISFYVHHWVFCNH